MQYTYFSFLARLFHKESDLVSEKLVLQLDLPSGIYFARLTTSEGEVFTYQIPLINIER